MTESFEPWYGEIWRDCVCNPCYRVSNAGRVISFMDQYLGVRERKILNGLSRELTPRLMIPQEHRLGYLYVTFKDSSGISRKRFIHRLVAEAFIPNPKNKPEINHINGVKTDNYPWNLEWCTHSENIQHARRTGLMPDSMYMKIAAMQRKSVYCYETDTVYDSVDVAAEATGVYKSQVSRCCQGKDNHAGGFHFCYGEDIDLFLANIDAIILASRHLRPVVAIRVDTGEEIYFSSRREASKALGIPDSYISNIIAGRNLKTRGWTFRDRTPEKYLNLRSAKNGVY